MRAWLQLLGQASSNNPHHENPATKVNISSSKRENKSSRSRRTGSNFDFVKPAAQEDSPTERKKPAKVRRARKGR